MKLEFLQIFGKYSNIKFHESPSSGNRALQYRQTDEHRDRDKRRS